MGIDPRGEKMEEISKGLEMVATKSEQIAKGAKTLVTTKATEIAAVVQKVKTELASFADEIIAEKDLKKGINNMVYVPIDFLIGAIKTINTGDPMEFYNSWPKAIVSACVYGVSKAKALGSGPAFALFVVFDVAQGLSSLEGIDTTNMDLKEKYKIAADSGSLVFYGIHKTGQLYDYLGVQNGLESLFRMYYGR